MTKIKPDISNEFSEIIDFPDSIRHRLLQSDWRGLTISILAEQATPIPLENPATSIANWENEFNYPAP